MKTNMNYEQSLVNKPFTVVENGLEVIKTIKSVVLADSSGRNISYLITLEGEDKPTRITAAKVNELLHGSRTLELLKKARFPLRNEKEEVEYYAIIEEAKHLSDQAGFFIQLDKSESHGTIISYKYATELINGVK